MMISFWSPVKDEYVSSIAVLSAMAGCEEFSCKVALADNYVGQGNIGRCLFGDAYNRFRKDYDRYQSEYYERRDSFLKFLRKETGMPVYKERTLEYLHDRLFFLPLNQSLRSDIYEYGFERELPDILEFCKARFDFLFLNTESRGNLSTKTILDYSDKVVVCMPNAEWVLDLFIEQYSSIISKSILFFHGDPDSGFLRRMRRKYSRYRANMMYLPLTDDLKEAIRDGRLREYCEQDSERRREKDYSNPVMQKVRYMAFSAMRCERQETKLRYDEMRTLFAERNADPSAQKYSLPTARTYVAERETAGFCYRPISEMCGIFTVN